MTKIEKFAIEHMGITLTLYQVEMIRRWSLGATVTVPKRSGVSTAKQVYYRYMQDSVKPDDTAKKVESEFNG